MDSKAFFFVATYRRFELFFRATTRTCNHSHLSVIRRSFSLAATITLQKWSSIATPIAKRNMPFSSFALKQIHSPFMSGKHCKFDHHLPEIQLSFGHSQFWKYYFIFRVDHKWSLDSGIWTFDAEIVSSTYLLLEFLQFQLKRKKGLEDEGEDREKKKLKHFQFRILVSVT